MDDQMTRAARGSISGSSAPRADGPRDEITVERLERALAAISYAILLDGPIYAPVLDRLEREIAAARASEDVVSRARQYLEQFRNQAAAASSGDVKEIA
jgi:hypothetical protein